MVMGRMAAPEHSCTSDVLAGMRQLAHADPKVSWSAPVPNMDNYIIQSVDDILMCVPTDVQDKCQPGFTVIRDGDKKTSRFDHTVTDQSV